MWNSLRGYVIIQMEGSAPERFLNRMLKEHIPVWDIRREGRTKLYFAMRVRDFRNLRTLCKDIRCRIHIVKRYGVPFFFARFRHRKVLLIGCTLLVAAMLMLSGRIWFIRVSGCYHVHEDAVLHILEQAGVTTGVARASLNLPALRDALRASDERIVWAGSTMNGVMLDVQIVESESPETTVQDDGPADVIAAKDGVILKVTALAGQAQVHEGDVVRKGTVLIDGQMKHEKVHAQGEIFAQVCYTAQSTLPLACEQYVHTGKQADYRKIEVFGICMDETICPFEHAEAEVLTSRELHGTLSPIRIQSGVWHETGLRQVEADPAELEEEALYQAERKALEMIPEDAIITSKTSAITANTSESITATVNVYTKESIGLTVLQSE